MEILRSPRQCHPQRIIDFMTTLTRHGCAGRGYCHVPTRTHTCAWQAAGGGFLLGLGPHTPLRGTMIAVCGTGEPARSHIREAFSACLLSHSEEHVSWAPEADCFADLTD